MAKRNLSKEIRRGISLGIQGFEFEEADKLGRRTRPKGKPAKKSDQPKGQLKNTFTTLKNKRGAPLFRTKRTS